MVIPKHVGFIMDGNRRWARKHGLPASAGHKKGFEHIPDVLEICHEIGIQFISIYCWSTENWNRSAEEVDYIMRSLENELPRFVDELNERGVRFIHSGRREELSSKTLLAIDKAVDLTKNNGSATLNFLFNYGGRAELVNVTRKLIAEKVPLEQISETSIADHLWSAGIPDVDLVIRTGGDTRLSNFMLWQIAYASIYVAKTFWPDINRRDIEAGIKQYNKQRQQMVNAPKGYTLRRSSENV